jgi:single-strand DNA-binding protein
MINKVILIGHLTADPDVRATAAGKHITSFRLATNTFAGKDDEGSPRELTDFHSLVAFGKLGEFAAEYLRKGRLVYAEGRSRTRSWETNDGQRRYSTDVVVDALKLLGPRLEERS